jgi:carbonic anhydrase
VTTACDAYRCPETYADVAVTHELRSIIDQLQIAARAAALALENNSDTAQTKLDERSTLTSVAVYVNAAVTALSLEREIRMFGAHSPAVVFGVYDFDSMRVQELPGSMASGLRAAPQSAKELTGYAREVAASLLAMDEETQSRSCQMTVQW